MQVARPRPGFSLVEVMVVLAIIAVLMGLLLPAVQRARESANLTKCQNNLRQIGIAAHQCHDAHQRLPSGGWGWGWVGMPDRGTGPDQPGGWVYNILPYVDQGNLRRVGSRQGPGPLEQSITELLATPLPLFNCPSRRAGGPYPADGRPYCVGVGATGGTVTVAPTRLARGDYAANAGSQAFNEIFAGPPTLAAGDDPNFPWPSTAACSGVFFQRSAVTLVRVSRGTSNTFMAGERYVDALHYADGYDNGDNEALYVGFDNDVYRVTADPPQRDRPGVNDTRVFGSAHYAGVYMLSCDGSVRLVDYDIDPDVFLAAGRRAP